MLKLLLGRGILRTEVLTTVRGSGALVVMGREKKNEKKMRTMKCNTSKF